MKSTWRMRFGFWLERFEFLHPVLLKYDDCGPGVRRYTNRINGHLVAKWD